MDVVKWMFIFKGIANIDNWMMYQHKSIRNLHYSYRIMYLNHSVMVLYNAVIDLQKQILSSMIPLTDLNKSIYVAP